MLALVSSLQICIAARLLRSVRSLTLIILVTILMSGCGPLATPSPSPADTREVSPDPNAIPGGGLATIHVTIENSSQDAVVVRIAGSESFVATKETRRCSVDSMSAPRTGDWTLEASDRSLYEESEPSALSDDLYLILTITDDGMEVTESSVDGTRSSPSPCE